MFILESNVPTIPFLQLHRYEYFLFTFCCHWNDNEDDVRATIWKCAEWVM